MADIDTDYNPNMPETEIIPKRGLAGNEGVPISSIANTIAAMIGGLKLLPNKYTDASGHRDDIQVKLLPTQNQDEVDISKIWVRNVLGEIRPLKSLVNLESGSTLLTITRYNRERGISIFGNFSPGRSQSEVVTYVQSLAKKFPEGYHVTFSGSTEAFQDSFRSLMIALLLGNLVTHLVCGSKCV